MGAKTVGALQYNEEDLEEAFAHVKVMKGDGPDTLHKFEITRDQPSPKSEQAKSGGENESTLRRRKVAKSEEETDELTAGVEELDIENKEINGETINNSNDGQKQQPRKDPLKWFGVLVPQCLRQGQKNFQQVQELCCSLATLQGELLALKSAFRQLNKEKNDLLDSVSLPSFLNEMNSSGEVTLDAPEN